MLPEKGKKNDLGNIENYYFPYLFLWYKELPNCSEFQSSPLPE